MDRSVTFTMTEGEYIAAGRTAVLAYFRRRGPMIAYCGFLVVYAAIIVSMATGAGPWVQLPEYVHLIFLGMLLFPMVNYFVLQPRAARRAFRERKTLNSPITFEWDDTSFKASGSGYETTVPWADYVKLKETSDLLLIYPAENVFQIIPKRILSPGQFAEIVAHVGRA